MRAEVCTIFWDDNYINATGKNFLEELPTSTHTTNLASLSKVLTLIEQYRVYNHSSMVSSKLSLNLKLQNKRLSMQTLLILE